MAGEEEERHVARAEALRQFAELAQQRSAVEVLAQDHVEAYALERAADRMRVAPRLLQLFVRGQIDVAVVADDEGDALFCVGWGDGAHERQPCDCNELRKSHLPL